MWPNNPLRGNLNTNTVDVIKDMAHGGGYSDVTTNKHVSLLRFS